MNSTLPPLTEKTAPLFIPAGEDRFGQFKTLGISQIAFKVSRQESLDLLMLEITLQQKGGPAKHVHHQQDEWFYLIEGDLLLEAGDQRFRLKPGDSLFVKRDIPHVWANMADRQMRFLASLTPAGRAQEFFENASKYNVLPGADQDLWRPYDLEWLGPPLKLD